MDRRGWLWKKRDSTLRYKQGDLQEEINSKRYVQITAEYYVHMAGLEGRVKELSEKLSTAQVELITKDNEAKQHAKVAEEAVMGWEKAEAESVALKNQLESVTSLKHKAEERANNLDGTLRECMKKMLNAKEEGEEKLRDMILAKTKQSEMVKLEMEAKIDEFEQKLQKATDENAAISSSLEDCSNALMKISDDKSQADAEIEGLKGNVRSCEKEIISLKYELHVVSKELEICNEEKSISLRTVEAANQQHSEDVKKVSKLEAECQRLRGLLRKKLPGPAALAQMKAEVGTSGRDYRTYRRPQTPGFKLVNAEESHSDNERVFVMEGEAKKLKEALSKCNSELQASRAMHCKASSKVRGIEEHIQVMTEGRSPSKASTLIGSNMRSLRFMSEDGIDEEGSCSQSWASELLSDLSQFMKEKDANKVNKSKHFNHLELMDDFLEMEMLASLSSETKGSISDSNRVVNRTSSENADLVVQQKVCKKQRASLELPKKGNYYTERQLISQSILDSNTRQLSQLQSRITSIVESETSDTDIEKLTEDIRQVVNDMQSELVHYPASPSAEDSKSISEDIEYSGKDEISSVQDTYSTNSRKYEASEEMRAAISHIRDFVISLLKESLEFADCSTKGCHRTYKAEEFSAFIDEVMANEVSLNDFILTLSHIFSESRKESHRMVCNMCFEGRSNNLDCIDKVTLLEKKLAQHASADDRFADCELIQHSLEEFEQLKLEKNNIETEMAKCTENFQHAKLQLSEMEENLAELQSKLAVSQNSNSLALTQLKCMAESYNLLETHKHELELEVNQLRSVAESLDRKLQEERQSHLDDIAKYNLLKEHCERSWRCQICMSHSDADVQTKIKQEEEIAAAAEKLAVCRESIFVLGKQLEALQPLSDFGSPSARMSRAAATKISTEELNFTQSARFSKAVADGRNMTPVSSHSSKHHKHKSSRSPSTSSSLSEMLLNERPPRSGFSRFFSRGKNNH